MYTLLLVISIIAAILLILVVLLQSSKGDGLSGTFGSAGNLGSVFGTRRTSDALSKITWWLAGTILVLALVTNLFFLPSQSSQEQRESIIQKASANAIPTQPALPQNLVGNTNTSTNTAKPDSTKK